MKKDRSGYRMEVYWEEFGTIKEGSMEDPRYHEILRKPTPKEMDKIEKGLERLLMDLGLVRK